MSPGDERSEGRPAAERPPAERSVAPPGGAAAPSGPAIRDAASVIVLRDMGRPHVLMGQRGARAAFMPSKFVFPGGAVDPSDARVPVAVAEPHASRLAEGGAVAGLVPAGIRELWEEAGLILGRSGPFPDPPPGWEGFAATGHRPSAEGVSFVFRAITPPGRPRRFDARFLLVDAAHLASDPDDFSAAQDELAALQWIALADARSFDLPFITEVVLAEVAAIARGEPQEAVPFFRNDEEESLFLQIHGRPQDR